ncbi:hydrolase, partial [Legionella sp. 28fTON52]
EQGQQSLIDAAVAVSVPFQLRLVADRISRGFSRVYQGYLLRRLREVFEQKKNNYTEDLPEVLRNMHKWQCFWTFDEFVTAPIHGFSNVHAYYREASSRRYLRHIATQTLIIHALDDPFMTPEVLPQS